MFNKILNKISSFFILLKLRKNIDKKRGKIIIKGKYWTKIDKTAKINLNGNLILGENSFGNNGRNILLRMDKNSVFNIKGNSSFFYGCDVILFEGATLSIGNSFINSDAKIRCHKSITIGDNCTISHDFTVMDSDAHYLEGIKNTSPIIIEDNVWIGTRVTILNGVTIGKGSVVAANSLVNKDVPPNTLVAGSPARIIKENITWKA